LHTAEASLRAAERAYEDDGDSQNTRDLAYIALRKAELAETEGSIASSEQNTGFAVRRGEAAKAQAQATTRKDLKSAESALASEKNVVANQKAELTNEKQRRQDAERRATDALATLADIASVKQESRGTVITLSGAVIFASGKADLLPGAQTKLDQVAEALTHGAATKILIEGHTDSRGSDALNQELSTRRAAAVRAYLITKGLVPDSLSSQGVGPSRPIADNETAEGRANNRRVEIIVQRE
jgi:outer membrane protein OmpA-like peptidoglycan-associated protein